MKDIVYNHLLPIYLKLKEIPFFLRILTVAFGVGGPLFVIGTIFPIGNYSINDTEVTFRDFWFSGAALSMLATGLLLTTISYGIYKRANWSKHIIITSYISCYIWMLVTVPERIELNTIFAVIVTCFFPIWYLYFKKSLIRYFE